MPTPQDLKAILDRLPDLDAGFDEKGGKRRKPTTGKLTGPPWPKAVADVFDPILAGGRDAIAALVAMLNETDDGKDWRGRYTLHGLAVYTCRPGKENERTAVIEAFLAAVGQDRPAPVKGFLVRELATVGDKRAFQALGALLADPDLGLDAAATLAAIGDGAAAVFHGAVGKAKGRNRLQVLQTLGRLKDAAAAPAFMEAAGDADPAVRLEAVWGLARLGHAPGADTCLKALEMGGYERIKAAQACLLLAEALAAAGKKADAKAVYSRLRDACTHDQEAYLRDACDRGAAALG